jgi:hypothetical protein
VTRLNPLERHELEPEIGNTVEHAAQMRTVDDPRRDDHLLAFDRDGRRLDEVAQPIGSRPANDDAVELIVVHASIVSARGAREPRPTL